MFKFGDKWKRVVKRRRIPQEKSSLETIRSPITNTGVSKLAATSSRTNNSNNGLLPINFDSVQGNPVQPATKNLSALKSYKKTTSRVHFNLPSPKSDDMNDDLRNKQIGILDMKQETHDPPEIS